MRVSAVVGAPAVALIALMMSPAAVVRGAGGQAARSVQDGVYTAAQAVRGKVIYTDHCSSCHGKDLGGGEFNGCEVPALQRDDFMNTGDLGAIFSRVKQKMPFDSPGTLDDRTYIDAIAYLLQENGFPAGTEALVPNAELLANVRLVKQGTTVRTGTLVQVVGCLTQGSSSAWMLADASDPVATASSSPTAADLKDGAAQSLGAHAFRLLNLPAAPDVHKGHKMEARGLLVRAPNDDRINVTSLEMVSASCGR